MDNSKEAVRARLKEWEERIKEREESGMTIPAFCEICDISVSKYHYWAKRIKQAKNDELPNEIVDVTELVKEDYDKSNILTVARSKNPTGKKLNVLCLKITPDTSEKLLGDVLKAFINA